jgi:Zn-finger nucleic acid-binding protein
MIVLELDRVEVDHCISCQGIWLDGGEMELLLEGAAGKETFLSSFQRDEECSERPRRCPICSKRMEKIRVGREERVCIDRCRHRDGIWLDRGELKEILEMNRFGTDHRVLGLLREIFAGETQKGG